MNKLILSFFVGIILFYLLNNIRLFTIGGVSSGCTETCKYEYSSEGIKILKCPYKSPNKSLLTETEKQTYINVLNIVNLMKHVRMVVIVHPSVVIYVKEN